MNVLVTGGTGFVGKFLVPELIKCGCSVSLLVRDEKKGKELFGASCKYIVGDVTDKNSLKGCCKNIDIVYHMVAKVGNQLPANDSFNMFREVNVEGTRNIIDEAETEKVTRFIFVSSIAAMGIVKDNPITEKSHCNPYLPYQVTKFEAEQLINERIKNGFPAIIVRPTKVYGVGEQEYSYLTLAKLCKIGFFPKVGKGSNLTSNIYITDFIQALISLLYKGTVGETYILSSDGSIEFLEVGRIIAKTINRRIKIVPIPTLLMLSMAELEEKFFIKIGKKPIVTKKNIEATVTDRVYDISKAKNDLGFNPEMRLEKGIETVVKWYLEKGLI